MAKEYTPTSTFWQILKSLIREDDTKEQKDAARKTCSWLVMEIGPLRKACVGVELELIGVVQAYFSKNLEAPSLEMFKVLVEKLSNPEANDALEAFVDIEDGLSRYDVEDLAGFLKDKGDEARQYRLGVVLDHASKINSEGATLKKGKGKVKLYGPSDAMQYVIEKIDNGENLGNNKTHGVLQEVAPELKETYEKIKATDLERRMVKTSLNAIDEIISMRKGNFVGILGYAGNRKSALLRTMLYNAAQKGFNVLHFSYEQSYEEEMIIYGIIHSHHPKFGNEFNLTVKAFNDGLLTEDEEEFLFNECLPDLETMPGKLFVRQPIGGGGWEGIKTQASIQDRICPIDVLAVDYLTLCPTKSGRKEEVEENIRDAKLFALNFRDGEGLLLVTPVQGNRDGYNEASKNEGVWDMSGIYMYPEYDKSLDVCLYAYYDDELKANGEIVLGSCKSRWSDNVKPFKAAINSAGMVCNLKDRMDVENIDVSGIDLDDL